MAYKQPVAPGSRSPLLPIFLIVLVDILGLTIILPLLPFYAEKFGASPFEVGLLITSYAACQLVSGPLLGRISDRVGRRPMLIVSQVGTLIGLLLLSSAESLPLVFLARIIDGVTAGNISLAQAYVSDVTAPERRARSFGIIGIAFGIGFLIGPAVSGYLSQFGYHYPVLAAAGLSALSILATIALLPGTRPAESKQDDEEGTAGATPPPVGRRLGMLDWGAYLEYFRRPVLSGRLLEFFLFIFAFSTFTSGFALFCERRFTWDSQPFGPREVGYVLAYVGFLGIILQGTLIGPLVQRFGEPRLIVAGFVAAAVAYVGLGFTEKLPMLAAVATVSAFGNGLLRPTLTSQITKAVGRHEQGVVLGLSQSLSSVAMILAPLLGNALIEHKLLTVWALVAAAFVAAGALVSPRRAPPKTSSQR
jgi:MFS family permease